MEPIKAAVLTIQKTSDSPLEATITFDWRCFEFDLKGIRPEDQWTQIYEYAFDPINVDDIISTLAKEITNKIELKGLGDRIWKLFPNEIQDSLKKFDIFADEVQKRSKSTLPFIVYTDILTIPWELCITRRKGRDPEETPAWFERYRIALEIFGISDQKRSSKEEERNKVAIILKPFEELSDKKFLSGYNEEKFPDELLNLQNLIEKIQRTQKVDIRLFHSPRTISELHSIEKVLSEGKHNLVLYLGSYEHKKGLTLFDPAIKRPEYFSIRNIGVSPRTEQAIFLDACSTSIQPTDCGAIPLECENPKVLLAKGASAYIGTIQKIQPTVAAVFARYFLESLFLKTSSLSEAIHSARQKSTNYFTDEIPNERYKIQSAFFSLFGRNTDILLNSFRRRRQQVKLIFPALVEEYFEGFVNYIYPASVPGVLLDKKENLADVVMELENTKNPFIAELSILQAANLISKYKRDKDKALVIIGGLFRLRPESNDCSLYYVGNLKQYNFLYCTDPLSAVTVMALTFLRSQGPDVYEKFAHKSGCRRNSYHHIYLNMVDLLDEKDIWFEPFLLAANYKKRFDDELRKNPDATSKISRIDLYQSFLTIIGKQYPNHKMESLPGSVLVTRKADLDRDKSMHKEILSRWRDWEEVGKKMIGYSESQDIIYSFTEEDMKAVIEFSEFVFEKLNHPPINLSEPLKEEDFVLVNEEEEMTDKKTASPLVKDRDRFKPRAVEELRKMGFEDRGIKKIDDYTSFDIIGSKFEKGIFEKVVIGIFCKKLTNAEFQEILKKFDDAKKKEKNISVALIFAATVDSNVEGNLQSEKEKRKDKYEIQVKQI